MKIPLSLFGVQQTAWMEPQNDPWSDYSYWGEDYVVPEHDFDECVNDVNSVGCAVTRMFWSYQIITILRYLIH